MDIYNPVKVCSKCNTEQPISNYCKNKSRKDGLHNWCNTCSSNRARNYYKDNKEIIKARSKTDYYQNKDKKREYKREYTRNRRNTDLLFKIKDNIGCLIRSSINRKGFTKQTKTKDILGCDYNTLKEHLESQFDSNMSWDNHGTYWDIDHIIPVSSAKTEEELIKLNHYTNLQPLESNYNRYIKKALIPPE